MIIWSKADFINYLHPHSTNIKIFNIFIEENTSEYIVYDIQSLYAVVNQLSMMCA